MKKNDSVTLRQVVGVCVTTILLSGFSYFFQFSTEHDYPSFSDSMKSLRFIDAIVNAGLFHLEQIALLILIFAILSAIILLFRLTLSVSLITVTATLTTILLLNIFIPSLLAENLWMSPLIFCGWYLLTMAFQKFYSSNN